LSQWSTVSLIVIWSRLLWRLVHRWIRWSSRFAGRCGVASFVAPAKYPVQEKQQQQQQYSGGYPPPEVVFRRLWWRCWCGDGAKYGRVRWFRPLRRYLRAGWRFGLRPLNRRFFRRVIFRGLWAGPVSENRGRAEQAHHHDAHPNRGSVGRVRIHGSSPVFAAFGLNICLYL
jgi:hypothetical protein